MSVAEYLADREGLTGAARAAYLRLLHEVFGFRSVQRGRIGVFLGIFMAVVAGVGIGVELATGAGSRACWHWLAMGAAGSALAIETARARRDERSAEREFEWRAYCLVVRPLILRDRPGLLDRNHAADRGPDDTGAGEHRLSVEAVLRNRGVDLWAPAGIGWACGSLAGLIWRFAAGPQPWFLALPVGAAVAGTAAWSVFRSSVFRRLHRLARDDG